MPNREFRSIAGFVLVLTAMIGCGGGGGDAPTGPIVQAPVFTSLSVNPTSTTLFTVAPGNTVSLSATPRDQNNQAMSGLGAPTFSSGDAAVSVSSAGEVTAVQAGVAQITASLSSGGVTRTAVASVTVLEAPAEATVTAPQVTFSPNPVHISAGGMVTWSIQIVPHNVTFSGAGAPENIPTISNASASRTFPTSGSYSYQCTVHAGMSGSVVVH